MLYILTNLTNGKKFIGKTNFNEYYLRQLLFSTLDNGEHYNKLLQKDWKKHNFKLELIESDDTVKEADNYINKYNLLNPTKGYNMYADLSQTRGRHTRKQLYNDDICLVWCYFPKIQFVSRTFGMQRNNISNRLANYNLFDGVYYSRNISMYEDFYLTSMRLLYTDNACYTANQILDRMLNRYNVSDMLRITPRKISKFYVTNGIASKKDKNKGCLVFCPK